MTGGDSVLFLSAEREAEDGSNTFPCCKKEQAGRGNGSFLLGNCSGGVSSGHQAVMARRKQMQGAASLQGGQGWLHRSCALLSDSFQWCSPGTSSTRCSEGLCVEHPAAGL